MKIAEIGMQTQAHQERRLSPEQDIYKLTYVNREGRVVADNRHPHELPILPYDSDGHLIEALWLRLLVLLEWLRTRSVPQDGRFKRLPGDILAWLFPVDTRMLLQLLRDRTGTGFGTSSRSGRRH